MLHIRNATIAALISAMKTTSKLTMLPLRRASRGQPPGNGLVPSSDGVLHSRSEARAASGLFIRESPLSVPLIREGYVKRVTGLVVGAQKPHHRVVDTRETPHIAGTPRNL